MDSALVVFTGEGLDQLIKDGRTASWVVGHDRALQCMYVVCTRNNHHSWFGPGPEVHRSAFLVGKIKDVVPSRNPAGRNEIHFSEYARVAIYDVWPGHQNPVWFTDLSGLGIDEKILKWEPVPKA